MDLRPEQTFVVPPNVLPRAVGDEMVILDLDSDRYFGLNHSGARFWALLAEGCSVEKTLQTTGQEFNVSADQLRTDLENLVTELLSRGLVTERA